MIELLAIKLSDGYFHDDGASGQVCPLTKASVYPLAQLAKARHLRKLACSQGHFGAHLVKLSISEEPWEETPCPRP